MADCMTFPETLDEFLEEYQFKDTEEVYTNGSMLIPVFRVKQWYEHIPAVDAMEVVRCKDCKYCHIEDEYEAWCYGGLPAVLTRATEDFCSHGQRREDGDA